ncbi:glycosyltransferase family 4 protein [Naumannella halotolerans]|uniref:glycosyltransferase family 4 protein n=1 Tax=Naumannella halotolerans TaxID=993414 RepID=UPI00370DA670
MKVAIVAESFLPQINGVTHSVLRLLEHLRDRGHQAIVLAPATTGRTPRRYAGFRVVSLPSVPVPGYPSVRVAATPQWVLERELAAFAPDVVHVAAPFVIGNSALLVARRLGLPSVAIYQTEIPSYAARYGLPQAEPLLWRWVRTVHQLATLTLAPSRYAREQLTDIGVQRVGIWGRGVDSERFDPRKRDPAFRRRYAPHGERLIGYVGRLASEKQIEDLAVLADLPRTRTVVIGDGPRREQLQRALPRARFLGQLTGEALPRAMASLDLFVHPGELETFCQTIQEAQASGVAPIAPARGGPLDLIDSSRTGWLYEPGDLSQLRARARDLLGDDHKRSRFGADARAAVEHRTWPLMCEQLLTFYAEAISEHRSTKIR